MKRIYGLWTCLTLFSLAGHAQNINLQLLVGSGTTEPIGIYFAPDNDTTLFILEQGGIIKLANAGTGTVSGTPFLNITSKVTSAGNEQGLLGMAFDPDYVNNGYFYVNYTRSGDGATVVSRFKRSAGNPLGADGASEDIVIRIAQPFSNHNGGQLQFGRDGYLYIGMGDGGSANDPQGNGQNGNALLAKMLRLDVAVDSGYAVPADNPFVNDPNVRDEIWSLGLRNPWRFNFDQKTADMWIADVGQNVWEEIDFEPAGLGGRNYGWRCYEGNVAFNTSGCQPQSAYVSPVAVYNHSGGNCSVTGGFVYRGGTYADLYGKYIYTDYCTGTFRVTYPDGAGGWTTNTVTSTPTLTFQITSFGQDSHGEMYVVSRDQNRIYRLGTANACAVADIYSVATGGLESCTGSIELMSPYGPDNTYAWYRNDTLLSETSNVLSSTLSGIYRVEVVNTVTACGDTATAEVIVAAPTPVQITTPVNEFCAGAPVNLSADVSGGVFSGPGVSGSEFDPAGLSGPQTVVYSYTNTDGCISHDTVTVNALPGVSVILFAGMDTVCLNAQDVLIGTPPGGTYFGPGLSADSLFSAQTAGVGTHTLSYAYVVSAGCGDTAEVQIVVDNCYLDMAEQESILLSVYPNPSTGYFTIRAKQPIAEVSVYSSTGGHLRQTVHSQAGSGNELLLDMTGFSSGVYLIGIRFEGGQRADYRIILQKPWEK